MKRTEQIELAKEWEALERRMTPLKDELETLRERKAEIEDDLENEEGATRYELLNYDDGPEFATVIHELGGKYPGTVDYEFQGEAFNLLGASDEVIATISEQEMIDTMNRLLGFSASELERYK